jgi:hypothetical protein
VTGTGDSGAAGAVTRGAAGVYRLGTLRFNA